MVVILATLVFGDRSGEPVRTGQRSAPDLDPQPLVQAGQAEMEVPVGEPGLFVGHLADVAVEQGVGDHMIGT